MSTFVRIAVDQVLSLHHISSIGAPHTKIGLSLIHLSQQETLNLMNHTNINQKQWLNILKGTYSAHFQHHVFILFTFRR